MPGKFAILMDGGFVKKKLKQTTKNFPSVADFRTEVARIKAHPALVGHDLLRVYFYDAPPASGAMTNPISQAQINLNAHPDHPKNVSLHQLLEVEPDFALRMGESAIHGWTIGNSALKQMARTPRQLVATDMVPNIEQKGVDLRIGLDIARLALREMVSAVVVVTGDSDLVPAFKFARREGCRVYLDHMGHSVRRELKVHADLIL
ncbi:MAG: NYN domain-containing protein [Bradyrhizobium sp.]|uniref:NYN domain-containing protein n=1 Tax=Bradyrhizobium sp. TaxID=376 RepID=UPI001C2966D4|nr:NYN domain-containing protein [Bradyrhizobium sp.]MBU6462245.1 NYN domain-containing protein [Pseudomonadota bacterium]MDE2067298.1 NYN domain-containing protein [Bradyrhizobium sp.]MDE2243273.1 NYN domain-containing protein [Bradyrhizobium sp.]